MKYLKTVMLVAAISATRPIASASNFETSIEQNESSIIIHQALDLPAKFTTSYQSLEEDKTFVVRIKKFRNENWSFLTSLDKEKKVLTVTAKRTVFSRHMDCSSSKKVEIDLEENLDLKTVTTAVSDDRKDFMIIINKTS